MIPLLPAALAALFAFGCGTLWGGASALGAAAGQLSVLLFALLGAGEATDPWRLGRRLGWLPWGCCAVLAASLALSPVPRAGRVVLLLAPAFVLAVPAAARCLGDARARERGVLALILVADAVAIAGLSDLARGAERAARPLGHHQLLAAFLVVFFPLALLQLGRAYPWRALGVVSSLAIGGAVVASRSLLGLLALAAVAAWVAVASRRAWRLVLGLSLLAGAAAVPRLERVLRGDDPSGLARLGYLEAGWRGIVERPLLGWGPGSTPWTVARFLEPAPALRPAGELVGDLHSVPAQVFYESGVLGAALALATLIAFGLRRRRGREAADRRLARAAGVGLAGLGIVALGNGGLAIPALPLAAALVAGLAMAVEGGAADLSLSGERSGWHRWGRLAPWVARTWLVVAAVLLTPLALAERSYERAIEAETATGAVAELGSAHSLDPGFPLYRARRAWLESKREMGSNAPLDGPGPAEEAHRAAVEARSVAPFWLAAGVAGRKVGASWSLDALVTACELDPMGPIAPFLLAAAVPEHPRAPEWAARAVASEPGLLAATFWERHEQLLDRTLSELEGDPRLDLGFRAELVARAREVVRGQGGLAELGLTYDGRGATAGSLYLFRRRPWRAQLGGIEVRKGQIGKLALPSAAQLTTTAPEFFARSGCRP